MSQHQQKRNFLHGARQVARREPMTSGTIAKTSFARKFWALAACALCLVADPRAAVAQETKKPAHQAVMQGHVPVDPLKCRTTLNFRFDLKSGGFHVEGSKDCSDDGVPMPMEYTAKSGQLPATITVTPNASVRIKTKPANPIAEEKNIFDSQRTAKATVAIDKWPQEFGFFIEPHLTLYEQLHNRKVVVEDKPGDLKTFIKGLTNCDRNQNMEIRMYLKTFQPEDLTKPAFKVVGMTAECLDL